MEQVTSDLGKAGGALAIHKKKEGSVSSARLRAVATHSTRAAMKSVRA